MMNEAEETLRQLGIMDLTPADANLAWKSRRFLEITNKASKHL